MKGLRSGGARNDARRLFLAAPVFPAGCGFALAFGWLWFPALREILLSGLFAGHAFQPAVFGLALGAGFLTCGFGLRKLEYFAAERKIHKIVPAVLVHGLALALLGLALPALTRNAGWLPEILIGFGAALPGVWWTSRLFSLGLGKAVASLAWAAGAVCLPMLPLAVSSAGPGSGSISPVFAACALVIGLAVALGLACLMAMSPALRNDADASPPPGSVNKADIVLLRVVAALFFGLGCLNVLVRNDGGVMPAMTQVCGLALAAYVLNRQGRDAPGQPERRTSAAIRPGACALAVLALGLPFLSTSAPIVFGAGTGLVQAAGLALCAAIAGSDRSHTAPLAGVFLALTLAAVNGGYLAGLELAAFADTTGPVLAALAAAAVAALPFPAAYRERRVIPEEISSAPLEREPSEAAANTVEQPAIPYPAITEDWTDREKALTLLLLNGYNNKAVAEALGLTENTVRWYIKKLNKKTGAASRSELIALLRGM